MQRRTRDAWALAVLAAAAVAPAIACNAITGLDKDYVEVDCEGGACAAAEAGTPPATTTTSTTPPPVCTPLAAPDAGVPDAAPRDASGDAMADAAGSADAGTCPPPTVGTCAPANVATFMPQYKPPTGGHQGKCTSAQLDAYFTACDGPSSSRANCAAFRTNNAACATCLESQESAPSWGPLVFTTNGVVQINIPGCIAILEPCNETCARAYEAALQCEFAACETNCPVTTDPATLQAFQTCDDTADRCGCSKYAAGSTCAEGLTGPGHPAAICTSAADFQTYFKQVAPVFCGP